ncbi:hypothetical protein [Streptomyces huiliensis]|uniref:hypothetical protein n=1 Tax=Streptomyces huiliensis TaxID=2876027 RepID=UPI001CBDBF10|nr:hypothetical protein [Streptomyces huiliensis]MBZ4319564.1 hypothetical protein [Streptomyces huiliensis]
MSVTEPVPCHRCGNETTNPMTVEHWETASNSGYTLYTCAECVAKKAPTHRRYAGRATCPHCERHEYIRKTDRLIRRHRARLAPLGTKCLGSNSIPVNPEWYPGMGPEVDA